MKRSYIAALVITLAAISVFVFIRPDVSTDPVACTMEAKICPDGSAVGRTGPNCEFAPCPTAEANIRVSSPVANQEVGLPLTITGEARVFENSFAYRLLSGDGKELLEGYGMADAPDIGQFGPFSLSVNYPDPKTETGTLEVFQYSAKDGTEVDKVTVPVRFADVETSEVKIFFANQKKDPNATSCAVVYPVTRRIAKTQAVATEALRELLRGVSASEYEAGYLTQLNSGVELNSLVIENGVAKADFNEMLDWNVAGSCAVTMIRSQIENTLKQFPTVKNVVISIEGNSSDILQP